MSLNWQAVTDYRDPKWSVKGTRLAQAVYGWKSRFAIVEIRTLDLGVRYGIADADTVSDADVKAGKRPEIVRSYDTLDECVAAIDRATAKLAAAYDALAQEDVGDEEESECGEDENGHCAYAGSEQCEFRCQHRS